MQQEYGGEAEEGQTEETAFELGCREEDFARMRKGQRRFGDKCKGHRA